VTNLCGFWASNSLKNIHSDGSAVYCEPWSTPVADVPRGEAPFFPMLLLVADSASGRIVGMEMFSTVDGFDSIVARIPETLAGILKKAKIIPATIAAQNPILLSALEACCDA